MTNANDLAFPTSHIDPDRRFEPQYHSGLTKREYFAAMAMQGILSNPDAEYVAQWSVDMADAIIEALNKTDK